MNDDETLTFRLKAIAENMGAFGKAAKGADDVNSAMLRSKKTAEALATSNRKLTAARDKEADAAGRVRVAESKLEEVRKNEKSKLTQIAAAEERVASARRNSSRATNDANKIEQDFRSMAEKALARSAEAAGQRSGRSFRTGFRKSTSSRQFEDEIANGSKVIGSTFGSGILSGLQSALRSEAGPAIAAGLVVAAAIAAPAIGAVLAGGIVAAFGAGIATLGIVFAAKSEVVKTRWKTLISGMGADMQLLAKPFEGVLIHIANTMQTTFGKFAPILQKVFAASAGPIQRFADDAIGAIDKFRPALIPITDAFNKLLAALGPGLKDAFGQISDALIILSNSVARNPKALADLVRGLGGLISDLLKVFANLNDANGAFERLTRGTSAVTVVMDVLRVAVTLVTGPLVVLGDYIRVVSAAMDAMSHDTKVNGQSMVDAANKTSLLAQGLRATGGAAKGAAPPQQTLAEKVAAAAKSAADAKKKFEDYITQLFRLQNLALALSGSQIAFKQAIAAASAAVAQNGKTLNINTKAGQDNRLALNAVADAANKQTEQMTRSHVSLVTINRTASLSSAAFVKMAVKMGATVPQARAMARQLIAIPNVTREAKLIANKKDLETKLAAAKRALNDKDLTKERRAKINADIVALQRKLSSAQTQINNLHGKTIEIKYTSNGVNLTAPSRVGGKAGGGRIDGPGGGTSDRAGVFALSNKEWVIRAKASQKYGDYAMGSVNAGTATIIPDGMATGGQVNIHSRNMFDSVAQGNAYLTRLLGGPALGFAKSQVGKPYLWGGVGPSGYDCSGFLSAIVNVIRGQNPYHRLFATGSLPGGLFAKGSGRFNIGWLTGNPGHTAGTLNGVNVESRGGRGVVVGGGARGAGDAMFNSGIWHLKGYARGGKVGDPPYDGFAEWLAGLKSYAKGTPYVPRDGLAYLHRGEKVTPAGGEAQRLHPADIKALADALDSRPLVVTLDGRVIQQSMLKLKRTNGGIDLGLT